MAWTSHGHHIADTPIDCESYSEPAKDCGGPSKCAICESEVRHYHIDNFWNSPPPQVVVSKGVTQETRTTSSTGGMKGVKPERYSLIPVEALDILARLYGFGAKKYDAHNWRKGYEWSKSYDSLMRHATSFWRGEDFDEETELPHLAGVAFHALTLIIFMEEQRGFDDRFIRKPAIE